MVRLKSRYIVAHLAWKDQPSDELNEAQLVQAIRDKLQVCCGDLALGAALSSLAVRYFSSYTHVVVLRAGQETAQQVLQALVALNTLQLRRVTIEVHQVAGTLRNCIEAALKVDKQVLQARHTKLPPAHLAAATSQQTKLLTMDG